VDTALVPDVHEPATRRAASTVCSCGERLIRGTANQDESDHTGKEQQDHTICAQSKKPAMLRELRLAV
jgi:hypothetical protein